MGAMMTRALVTCFTAAFAVAGAAGAASFTYVSQTGAVSASGGTTSLGSDSQLVPIAGLTDVDVVAAVEDGDSNVGFGVPPGFYSASGSLQTTLAPTRLHVAGATLAEAIWDGVGVDPWLGTSASSDADVEILFDLAVPTLLLFESARFPGVNNAPQVFLEHLDIGFGLSYNPLSEPAIDDCGSLSSAQCDLLPLVFGPGGTVPGGSYRFYYQLFAFQPVGSCSVGCNDASGTGTLTIIPEPSTGLLFAAGLALGAHRRRRHCSARNDSRLQAMRDSQTR
jgi:hypothetical protein